ncbi:hypothetical protein QBC33DRAFT_623909 [Phialemonium atrogriseum]|uniref:Uncharacterized protein n=1 Tax=Phialemonium atrogriseum TaxID=1093897 RepID=A0AAJ0BPY8_9PEZI|nr:uncharacterized protein QBC33DRAFT_623909 [Phialemonium atrogriseum]KAK1762151.1 hypothetical protein QBC33DRAFT_623909 [Phialemonium atrogriseum]
MASADNNSADHRTSNKDEAPRWLMMQLEFICKGNRDSANIHVPISSVICVCIVRRRDVGGRAEGSLSAPLPLPSSSSSSSAMDANTRGVENWGRAVGNLRRRNIRLRHLLQLFLRHSNALNPNNVSVVLYLDVASVSPIRILRQSNIPIQRIFRPSHRRRRLARTHLVDGLEAGSGAIVSGDKEYIEGVGEGGEVGAVACAEEVKTVAGGVAGYGYAVGGGLCDLRGSAEGAGSYVADLDSVELDELTAKQKQKLELTWLKTRAKLRDTLRPSVKGGGVRSYSPQIQQRKDGGC